MASIALRGERFFETGGGLRRANPGWARAGSVTVGFFPALVAARREKSAVICCASDCAIVAVGKVSEMLQSRKRGTRTHVRLRGVGSASVIYNLSGARQSGRFNLGCYQSRSMARLISRGWYLPDMQAHHEEITI